MIRVDTITELYDVADLLVHQPQPRGDRIAVVGNSDSLGLLTYRRRAQRRAAPAAAAGPDHQRHPAGPGGCRRRRPRQRHRVRRGDPADRHRRLPPVPRLRPARPRRRRSGRDHRAVRGRAAHRRPAGAGGRKPLLLIHLALAELATGLRGTVPAYLRPSRARAGARGPARRLVPGQRRHRADPRIRTHCRVCGQAAGRRRPRRERRRPPRPGRRRPNCSATTASDVMARHQRVPGVEADAAAPPPSSATWSPSRPPAASLRHRADLGSVRLDLKVRAELRRAHQESTALLGSPTARLVVVQRMAARGGMITLVPLPGSTRRRRRDPLLRPGRRRLRAARRRRPLAAADPGHRPGGGRADPGDRRLPRCCSAGTERSRWTPTHWRSCCCGSPSWWTTSPRSPRSSWNRWSSPRAGWRCSARTVRLNSARGRTDLGPRSAVDPEPARVRVRTYRRTAGA